AAVVDDEAGEAMADRHVEVEAAVAFGFVRIAVRSERAGQGNAEEAPIAHDEAQAAIAYDEREPHREGAEALAYQALIAAGAFELLARERAAAEAARPQPTAAVDVEAHFDWHIVGLSGKADDCRDEAREQRLAATDFGATARHRSASDRVHGSQRRRQR